MTQKQSMTVDSEIGPIAIDATGAALGVARVAAEKSYQGIGKRLKKVIETDDPDAWKEIKEKIEYTYTHLDKALSALQKEENFLDPILQQVKSGKKVLFKPNLVSVENIEPYTHLPVPGTYANTEWAFVAAIMRWFHDTASIRYDQMCLGEAASCSLTRAAKYTHLKKTGRPVTPEATYEGKSDDFYGGWGFYFARRYLAEASNCSPEDDPMNGLEESMAGTFIAPGDADNKLMVYDLNRISDDPSRGRSIHLPDGENFKNIILHKTIVGGDPSDDQDKKRFPGCVLINLPKLKIHTQAIFTNAIKNLGIGLYPLQANQPNCKCGCWAYATPDETIPSMKSRIPHQVWVPDMDPDTLIPKKDKNNHYLVTKTGGLTGTMLDIIRAVASQDVFMMHIVDAIEAVNRDHQGVGLGIAVPEGLIVAGVDVVATDLACARYMFSNVGLKEAQQSGLEDGFGGIFPQKVPLPKFKGKTIGTDTTYDSPIDRDASMLQAQKYGMGKSDYYIKGWDAVSDSPLASSGGRLGHVTDNTFCDIHTQTLYWDMYKMPWDIQQTFLGYLDAVDTLEGSGLKKQFLDAFDETGNGTVSYEENGKKGIFGPGLYLGGLYMSLAAGKDDSDAMRAFFAMTANPLRGIRPDWNPDGHHFNREFSMGAVAVVAQMMSTMTVDVPDQHYPDMTWGNGNWPSFSQARDAYLHQVIYGWKFPKVIGLFSLFGSAIAYADMRMNDRKFVGNLYAAPNPKAPQAYLDALKNKEIKPLDFTVFVPKGYGAAGKIPHIQETDDPAKIFTAQFDQGKIQWPDATLNGAH